MKPEKPAQPLTREALDRFLEVGERPDARLNPYLDAAAVLASFDPFGLRPVGDAPAASVVDDLLPQCEPITVGPERGLWSLSLPERRGALRRLATRPRMRAALAANPRRRLSTVQRMFESVVRQERISLADAGRDDLVALLELHGWLDGILDDLPDDGDVARHLARLDISAPLRRLVGESFVGRYTELSQLERYVFDPERRNEPLFVYGPGGVGKSTLISRFILRHIGRADLRVVYIDIDRPTIRPESTQTLVLDAIAQLRTQAETVPSEVQAVVDELTYTVGRQDSSRHLESFDPNPPAGIYASAVGPLLGGATLLLVVDTFEEAQFLGSEVVWDVLSLLGDLASSVGARVVISGRALPADDLAEMRDVRGYGSTPPIDLGVLAPEAARRLLASEIREHGVPPLSTAELDTVVRVVTPNPMCVKLAARVIRDEGVDKLRSAPGEFLTTLKAEKVQALLYGRILRHLHSDDVRAIAHPGLVVRRITPDVIRDVLAGPCGITLTEPNHASWIFNKLRREAALVEVDPDDGSLRHRTDVRRAMLEDLTDRVHPDVVRAIDEAAVAHYERHDDPISRAEEIYHRLRLHHPTRVLEERWMPAAGGRLKSAGEELPAKERLWLAGKLNITLDPSVRQQASQEVWEEQAARSVERSLSSGAADKALAVLAERPTRLPRSRLYGLEAETYRFLDRPDEALRAARAGVDAAGPAGAVDLALDLLLKMVLIEEGRGDLEAAARHQAEATEVAPHSANRLLVLQSAVIGLRLERKRHPDADVRRRILDQLDDEVRHEIRERPVLLREAAAELGGDDADIMSLAVTTLGLEVASDAQAQALERAIASLDQMDRPMANDIAEAIRALQKGFARRDIQSVSRLLASAQPGDAVLLAFRDYFRAVVDDSLRRR
jgi:cellulose synthase operon protein C